MMRMSVGWDSQIAKSLGTCEPCDFLPENEFLERLPICGGLRR
jgi:hypothetical protein